MLHTLREVIQIHFKIWVTSMQLDHWPFPLHLIMASHMYQAWKSMLGASCNSWHSTRGIFDNWTLAGTVHVHVTSTVARDLIPKTAGWWIMAQQTSRILFDTSRLCCLLQAVRDQEKVLIGRGTTGLPQRSDHRAQAELCHLWAIRIT